MSTPPKPDLGFHYRNTYSRKLTDSEVTCGHLTLKIDPYRVCKMMGVGGGPREHAMKKLMRGGDKGHSEAMMWEEVIACATRALEMIVEDQA
jgi:hypothetical protein